MDGVFGYTGVMETDPNALVLLTTARTDFEAETIAEALRAQGIRAEVFAAAASVMQNAAIPVQVLVQEKDLVAAKNALRAIKAESVDIDWSEVDTGDRAPVACPRCNKDEAKGPGGSACPACGVPLPRVEAQPERASSLTASEWKWVLVIGGMMLALIVGLVVAGAMRR